MPRPRSNIGHSSRHAITEHQRRSNCTDQERLDKIYVLESELLKGEQKNQQINGKKDLKPYEMNREEEQHNSLNNAQEQLVQQRRRMQLQYLNDRASYHRIAFSYEPDIQYNTSCKFVQIRKMDTVCPCCKARKFKEKLGMCCPSRKVKLPEPEQPKEPLKFVKWNY